MSRATGFPDRTELVGARYFAILRRPIIEYGGLIGDGNVCTAAVRWCIFTAGNAYGMLGKGGPRASSAAMCLGG
jgi:hypothetical protein